MKHQRFFLATIITLNFFSAPAQKTDKALMSIKYSLSHVIDTTQRDYPQVRPFMLVIGADMSLYDDYYAIMWLEGTPVKTTSVGPDGKISNGVIGSGGGGDSYIKHNSDNKITTVTYAGSAFYAIESPMPDIKWTILSEQKTIKEYKCQKATGSFKGRNYTAWFTDQIPYRNGPWKLGGLPGLILEASDDMQEVVFTCAEIALAPGFKPIEVDRDAIAASFSDVQRIKDAVEKDKQAFKGAAVAAAPSSGIMVSGNVRRGDAPPGRAPRKYNNPIEKEEIKK